MPRAKPIAAIDCETDPFYHGKYDIKPFLWGYYDAQQFLSFKSTADFVEYVHDRAIILYAHNGGKFDFMFLLPFIGETKAQIINGRIVSMLLGNAELRDSYAIIPVALKVLGGKRDIEIWKLEKENRKQYMEEIREYNYHDCKSLYDAVTAYRQEAGKYKTIASNALAFSKRLGIDPGKTNHRFDATFRPFYFGGRTECFKSGKHENLAILDIRSAYPFAMIHDHATGELTDFAMRGDDFGNLTRDEINRSFIELECTAKGCFPVRNKALGLNFPDAHGTYFVTGWEYNAAKDLNLISDERIIAVHYSRKTINFKAYVDYWFEFKQRHDKEKEPIGYTIGKIMQNSLYGKLAQNLARYCDYRIVKAGTASRMCTDMKMNMHDVCENCGGKLDVHGWTWLEENSTHEIHSRPSLWKHQYADGKDWISRKLYKNVATGASITGFTRAYLLRAMHAIGVDDVIYTDTDSIVCNARAKIESLPCTKALGDWEIEDDCAPAGYFAGKKLYAIELSKLDKATGKPKLKLASKGAKLDFGQIKRISEGEIIRWDSPSPHFSLAGNVGFVHRDIRATHTAYREKEENTTNGTSSTGKNTRRKSSGKRAGNVSGDKGSARQKGNGSNQSQT